ncbi:MAG: DUF4440 domain-containing protein [Gemmatimonadaceae bacterium]
MTKLRRFLCASALLIAGLPLSGQARPTDRAAIRAARAASNRAIAAHDADAAAAIWSVDYVGVSSSNVRTVGRDAERQHVANIFSARNDAVYVRTPSSVVVNAGWGQAAESGQWTGQWGGAAGTTKIGGVYFAKWKRESDGSWRIIAETFVQTTCSGTAYCDAPPPATTKK